MKSLLKFIILFILSFSLQFPSFSNPCKEAFEFDILQLIEKKVSGENHTKEEIHYIIKSFIKGEISDYQVTSWLTAVEIKKTSKEELELIGSSMEELSEKLKAEDESAFDKFTNSIFQNEDFYMQGLIDKKILGRKHSEAEISYIVNSFTEGRIPDFEMSAWAMAVRLNGLSKKELGFLTKAMTRSGKILNFKNLKIPVVDKHSTGGVGDKVSLILAPLCASCGVAVPMISGRGLGHTGGTLDKLESLPGFNINLSEKEMEKQIQKMGVFMAGQTKNIAPADKKIYALRDVTGTVQSQSLISASIMSKKLAEGLDALVMDVKFGSGGFMKNKKEALELAKKLKRISEYNGVKFRGLITNMDQPLGRFIGNSLEVQEVLTILKNEIPKEHEDYYNSTKELSLQLVSHMLQITGKVKTLKEGYAMAKENLKNGSAFKLFEKMCKAQGTCQLELPKNLSQKHRIFSTQEGYISSMNTQQIGMSSIFLGAGRLKKEDTIDHQVGIEMQVRLGDFVKKGHPLAILYYSKKSDLKKSEEFFVQSIGFSDSYKQPPQLIETTL